MLENIAKRKAFVCKVRAWQRIQENHLRQGKGVAKGRCLCMRPMQNEGCGIRWITSAVYCRREGYIKDVLGRMVWYKREVQGRELKVLFFSESWTFVDYQSLLVWRFDFSQEYIPHGYKELCLAPTPDGEVCACFTWPLHVDRLHLMWCHWDVSIICYAKPQLSIHSFVCSLPWQWTIYTYGQDKHSCW